MFFILLTGCINLFLLGCDRVEEKHITLSDARKHGAFDRGWLPDILPDSTFDIKMSNNVDTGESEGEFKFKSEDSDVFFNKLEKINLSSKNDSSEYYFSQNKKTWQFKCQLSVGHCKYELKS